MNVHLLIEQGALSNEIVEAIKSAPEIQWKRLFEGSRLQRLQMIRNIPDESLTNLKEVINVLDELEATFSEIRKLKLK